MQEKSSRKATGAAMALRDSYTALTLERWVNEGVAGGRVEYW